MTQNTSLLLQPNGMPCEYGLYFNNNKFQAVVMVNFTTDTVGLFYIHMSPVEKVKFYLDFVEWTAIEYKSWTRQQKIVHNTEVSLFDFYVFLEIWTNEGQLPVTFSSHSAADLQIIVQSKKRKLSVLSFY